MTSDVFHHLGKQRFNFRLLFARPVPPKFVMDTLGFDVQSLETIHTVMTWAIF